MRRSGGQARFRFETPRFAHSRPIDEIREVLMVHDDRHALERHRLLLPARERRLPAPEERFGARAVALGIRGIDLHHAFFERQRNLGDIARIGVNVRIAAGMEVTERAVYDFWNFQPDDVLRGFEITRAAELDSGVPALREQERNPADLQLRAGTDQQVSGADSGNQAGPRFDAVWVLQCGRCKIDRYLVSAQLLRQGTPLGLAGEYVER